MPSFRPDSRRPSASGRARCGGNGAKHTDPTAFRAYLREFNAANYAALVRYYADDVLFSFGNGPTLRGRDAVVAFYRPFHEHVKETVEIKFLIMDHRQLRRGDKERRTAPLAVTA
jgi:ketosteroid isomerase-like protein